MKIDTCLAIYGIATTFWWQSTGYQHDNCCAVTISYGPKIIMPFVYIYITVFIYSLNYNFSFQSFFFFFLHDFCLVLFTLTVSHFETMRFNTQNYEKKQTNTTRERKRNIGNSGFKNNRKAAKNRCHFWKDKPHQNVF